MQIRRNLVTALLVGLFSFIGANLARSAKLPDFEAAAERLQQSTVTIRVSPTEKREADNNVTRPRSVIVCSGVVITPSSVVSYVPTHDTQHARATLAGGRQVELTLAVRDHHSGLSLWTANGDDLVPLQVTHELPKVGAWVLAGAGWGADQPVVSLGVVSGVDRFVAGSHRPPLLQCDIRTTDTSAGGPLVDRQGSLVGIIASEMRAGQLDEWCFALPVHFVQILREAQISGKVVTLKQLRPSVGMVLTPGGTADKVVVHHIQEEGPADKAGIRPGDQVLAADGVPLRSVYQAFRPIMTKRPGDLLRLTVRRGETDHALTVVLGSADRAQDPDDGLVERRVEVDPRKPSPFVLGRPNERPEPAEIDETARLNNQVQLLNKALERYGWLIRKLQDELDQRDRQQKKAEQRVAELIQEIARLRNILDEDDSHDERGGSGRPSD